MVSSAQAKLGLPPPPGLDPPSPPSNQPRLTLGDFWAYMLQHNYIFAPTGELWPAASVNSRIPPIIVGTNEKGEPIKIPASVWLDQRKPVEQMTWSPGEPTLIARPAHYRRRVDRPLRRYGVQLVSWTDDGVGDAAEAGPWLDHVKKIYPNDADHIVRWFAHACSDRREDQPCARAWRSAGHRQRHPAGAGQTRGRAMELLEVSPPQLLGRFNGFLKSVILRVSEARDLGEVNRYPFYDHMKADDCRAARRAAR